MAQAARLTLFVCLGIIATGLERYFSFWAPALHYGFDAVVLGSSLIALTSRRQAASLLRTTGVLMAFIAAYLVWGLAVSPDQDTLLGRVVSTLILDMLLIVAVGASISDRRSVAKLANALQGAAIFNFGMALFELTRPGLVTQLALTQNPAGFAFNETRPSAFWSSPNDEGVMLLLIFLMSFWTRGWLAQAGRVAAIGGIYLCGSREGFYPLLLCLVILLPVVWSRARRNGQRLVYALGPVVLLALVVAVPFAIVILGGGDTIAGSVSRLLDATQSQSSVSTNPSRFYLVQLWLPRAIDGPWYGSGVFSFQGAGVIEVLGAHNLYLTLWGEAGLPMLALYLGVLALGFRQVVVLALPRRDRLLLVLLWSSWMFQGLVSHNVFSDVATIIFASLLFRLPAALAQPGYRERVAGWRWSRKTPPGPQLPGPAGVLPAWAQAGRREANESILSNSERLRLT